MFMNEPNKEGWWWHRPNQDSCWGHVLVSKKDGRLICPPLLQEEGGFMGEWVWGPYELPLPNMILNKP